MRTERIIRIETAFAVLGFSAIFLQKLGVPVPGTGGNVALGLPILLTVLILLLVQGTATIDPLRALLFAGLVITVLLSLFLQPISSLPAVLVFLSLTVTLLFVVEVDRSTMLRCMHKYQTAMMVIAVIVIGQQIVQFSIGNRYWPNLTNLIPRSLRVSGFMYLRPYSWGSPYVTPNGIFFLEPSAVSLFLAMALASEIVWFQRIRYMALYAGALLACLAGTGITIIAMLAPWFLHKMDSRSFKWTIGLGMPLLLIGAALGAFSILSTRSAELSESDSSGYERVVLPFNTTMILLSDPTYLLSGNGAGATPKTAPVQWPASKLIYEYGILTAIMYHVFILVAVLWQAPSPLVTMVVLIPTLIFGGGVVAVPNVMIMIMFSSLLRLRPEVSVLPGSQRKRGP